MAIFVQNAGAVIHLETSLGMKKRACDLDAVKRRLQRGTKFQTSQRIRFDFTCSCLKRLMSFCQSPRRDAKRIG